MALRLSNAEAQLQLERDRRRHEDLKESALQQRLAEAEAALADERLRLEAVELQHREAREK